MAYIKKIKELECGWNMYRAYISVQRGFRPSFTFIGKDDKQADEIAAKLEIAIIQEKTQMLSKKLLTEEELEQLKTKIAKELKL